MLTYETARQILAELDQVLGRVDEAEIEAFSQAVLKARRILIYGLGREGLALRGFAMRLMHIGFDVAVVGDVTAPPAGEGDIFLVACGPGYLSTAEALVKIARQAGAKVVMVTAQPEGPLPKQADLVLYIPAQTMAEAEGSSSGQAMGSAFEQSMWILFDALVPHLQAARNQSLDDLRRRHANLE